LLLCTTQSRTYVVVGERGLARQVTAGPFGHAVLVDADRDDILLASLRSGAPRRLSRFGCINCVTVVDALRDQAYLSSTQ
jgi:hypothetical protein